jgi:transcriptional regulator GlxA family with amidase domain
MPIASVAIYVFPDIEVLDFAGPYEVFTTASRVFKRRNPSADPPFRVFTVAQQLAPVKARAGLVVQPDFAFDSAPPVDLLIVPGGVVDAELDKTEVIDWIRACSGRAQLTASVCTGAFLLAKAGLLQGKAATTHWEDIADLRRQFPDVVVKEGLRWVDEGAVVTSAGIAAGIDMSLHLVARFGSPALASLTARQMDVPYRDNAEASA